MFQHCHEPTLAATDTNLGIQLQKAAARLSLYGVKSRLATNGYRTRDLLIRHSEAVKYHVRGSIENSALSLRKSAKYFTVGGRKISGISRLIRFSALPENPRVGGSIPPLATTKSSVGSQGFGDSLAVVLARSRLDERCAHELLRMDPAATRTDRMLPLPDLDFNNERGRSVRYVSR